MDINWLELILPIVKDLIIIAAITVLVPALRAGVSWWKNMTMEEWLKELVVDAVTMVQERYWANSGEEKFEYAKSWIVTKLNEKGINVSVEFIEGLIDAVVNQLRAELGEEVWYYKERNQE